ncbi:MAG: segregation/condensation protein A [Planctomycetes bacterium]|nr:segregation/condensation protein A [Planctomycetota bacterium]
MTDYRVNLDIYNGPLDLLLYLIRREEIDIHDIPIARITEQYCAYVDTLKMINPDIAGEFLVMAATLMEIKSRMLLPQQVDDDDIEIADPRTELVRQLLQYKAFKDAADNLRRAAEAQSLRFPRRPAEIADNQDNKEDIEIEEVQIWDLLGAFIRLMDSIGQNITQTETEIIYDDTPIELHMADIMDLLKRQGEMTFSQIFQGRTSRSELVGLFLALLELAKRGEIYIEQPQPFGEIYIYQADKEEGAD